MRFIFSFMKVAYMSNIELALKRTFSVYNKGTNIEKSHTWRASQLSPLSRRQIEFENTFRAIVVKRFTTSNSADFKKSSGEISEMEDQLKVNKVSRIVKPEKDAFEDSLLQGGDSDLIRKISGGDSEVENTLNSLKIKIDMLSNMYAVNLELSKENWIELLKSSNNMRARFISYLLTCAIKSQRKKLQKKVFIQKDFVLEEEDSSYYDDPACYHLFHNSMFLKFRTRSFKKRLFSKSIASILYSPEIYIDCSYDQYMNIVESKYLGKQIIQSITQNLHSDQPYNIILCNFNKDSPLASSLVRYSPLFYEDYFPITITSKSYLDLCPRENLVYLSPHSNKYMKTLDINKRYIIGGYVDKSRSQHVSLAKAKESKIPVVKFPIEKYLDWHKGSKNLCINHVFSIMLSLKNNRDDWMKAFEIIPRRHLTNDTLTKVKRTSKIVENVKYILSLGNPNEFNTRLKPDLDLHFNEDEDEEEKEERKKN